jgi:hypothetical protein
VVETRKSNKNKSSCQNQSRCDIEMNFSFVVTGHDVLDATKIKAPAQEVSQLAHSGMCG